MTHLSTMQRVGQLFSNIQECKSLSDINELVVKEGFDSAIQAFEAKYPVLDLSVTSDAVKALINSGVITNEYKINYKQASELDTLSKLLIAVLWKNGHIDRIKHLVGGILGGENEATEDAFIFRQFGKSLAHPKEPIIDRHVLRAFELYNSATSDIKKINKIRNTKSYNSDKKGLLPEYKKWLSNILEPIAKEEVVKFQYKLDKVLFCLGKEIFLDKKILKQPNANS